MVQASCIQAEALLPAMVVKAHMGKTTSSDVAPCHISRYFEVMDKVYIQFGLQVFMHADLRTLESQDACFSCSECEAQYLRFELYYWEC